MNRKYKKNEKRKIPVFHLQLNNSTYESFQQHPTVKKIVIEELVFAIKDGVTKRKKSVSLFQMNNTNLILELDRENWKKSLQNAIDYFVNSEEYEKCQEIKDLINKI
jgi:hypothetical protein